MRTLMRRVFGWLIERMARFEEFSESVVRFGIAWTPGWGGFRFQLREAASLKTVSFGSDGGVK